MTAPGRLALSLFLLHVLFISNAFVIQSESSKSVARCGASSRKMPSTPWPAANRAERPRTTRSTFVRNRATSDSLLRMSSSSSSSSTPSSSSLPDVEGMKIGEIRSELESYGISTKAFLEKKEMVAELIKARAEGKQPVKTAAFASASTSTKRQSTTGSTASSTQSTPSSGTGTSTSATTASRDDRIKEEMAKASKMGVADLKKELTRMGVSTKSFFEKSEFVKAYAEAIVDGVGVNGNVPDDAAEPYDPEYRDVVMQKMGRSDPRLLQGTVIDIPLKSR